MPGVAGQGEPPDRHVEGRVVQHRHERRAEEGTHDLADEVGARHACDAEARRHLLRDGALAGTRRAADQQDDRNVLALEDRPPAEAMCRFLAVLLAQHGFDVLVQFTNGQLFARRAAVGEPSLHEARDRMPTFGRQARRRQRLRHHALGIR